MSLTIYRKGLLLVFIPLFFNLFWIGLFASSIQRSSMLFRNASHHSDAILLLSQNFVHTNKMIMDIFDYVRSGGSPLSERRARIEAEKINDITEKLNAISKDDYETQSVLKQFDAKVKDVLNHLRNFAGVAALSEGRFDRFQSNLSGNFDTASIYQLQMLKILDDRQQDFANGVKQEELNCAQARLISLSGILINILLSVAMTFFMHRGIAKRVADLNKKVEQFKDETFEYVVNENRDEFALLENELLAARGQWLESFRFRKTFMANMADRLRIPLKVCREAAVAVCHDDAIDGDSQKTAQNLAASVSSCLSLIDDMVVLGASGGARLEIHPVQADIKMVVGEALALVSSLAARRNIAISDNCESGSVLLDIGLIRQVLVNFLSNAIKFSPPNSLIKVDSEVRESSLRASVSDTGAGMSEDVRARLFTKFYQSEEGKVAGGTGLGLAIAQMIVLAHGGTIGVESAPGAGASFWFDLPLTDSAKRF